MRKQRNKRRICFLGDERNGLVDVYYLLSVLLGHVLAMAMLACRAQVAQVCSDAKKKKSLSELMVGFIILETMN